jgi:hypothetical protein
LKSQKGSLIFTDALAHISQSFIARSAEATQLLSRATGTIEALDATFKQHFSSNSISAIQTEYSEKNYLEQNPSLLSALAVTEDALAAVLHDFCVLEQYLTLSIPHVEDGNNFGVSIQLQALKQVQDVTANLNTQLEALPKYFITRADAMDKLGLPTKSSSETTKVEQGEETKTTTTKEESIKASGDPTYHRIQAVYAVDAQFYATCQKAFRAVITSYIACIDFLLKNQLKIKDPRGKKAGVGMSSMY